MCTKFWFNIGRVPYGFDQIMRLFTYGQGILADIRKRSFCPAQYVYQTEKRMFADTRRRRERTEGREDSEEEDWHGGDGAASSKVSIEMSLAPLASKGRVESREFSDGRVIWQFTELPCSCSIDHATLPSLHVLRRPSFTPPVLLVFLYIFFDRLPRRRPIFHISGDL